MLRRYTFWLSAACLFQLLTAALHSISFITPPHMENESEVQLHTLMTTYNFDLGGGFHPSMWNLFTAVSTCFLLLCVLSALTNGYLMYKQAGPEIMRGILAINLVIFGVCFLVMAMFSFLPPVVLTGLIFINLLAAFLVLPKLEVLIDEA